MKRYTPQWIAQEMAERSDGEWVKYGDVRLLYHRLKQIEVYLYTASAEVRDAIFDCREGGE